MQRAAGAESWKLRYVKSMVPENKEAALAEIYGTPQEGIKVTGRASVWAAIRTVWAARPLRSPASTLSGLTRSFRRLRRPRLPAAERGFSRELFERWAPRSATAA